MRIAKFGCLPTEVMLVLFLGFLLVGPTTAQAQVAQPPCVTGQGFNGAYTECNGSNNSAVLNGSFAFIDAAQYMSSGDICQAINTILIDYDSETNHGNSQGIVVDARGVTPGNCQLNPWAGVSIPTVTNTVILLPSGTISLIPDANNNIRTWTLNKNTLLLGQGPNVTIIQAATGMGDMIHMGDMNLPCSNSGNCPAIQIEHLGLDGHNNTNVANAIVNQYSGELSDVQDVAITNIPAGTGLYLTYDAGNSGPYSNITMSSVGICVNINGLTGTRGIHGLTCATAASSRAAAAIFVDGSNNSIEDVSIQGGSSLDGILIGSQGKAQANLLFNVTGVGLKNVIELSANQTSNVPNVSDISILGLTNSGTGGTIKDDLNGGPTINDPNVGMYVLGELVQQNTSGTPSTIGYSRFSTSKSANAVTWVVGPNSLSPQTACTAIGDLYSRTSNATGNTLWYCASDHTWHPII